VQREERHTRKRSRHVNSQRTIRLQPFHRLFRSSLFSFLHRIPSAASAAARARISAIDIPLGPMGAAALAGAATPDGADTAVVDISCELKFSSGVLLCFHLSSLSLSVCSVCLLSITRNSIVNFCRPLPNPLDLFHSKAEEVIEEANDRGSWRLEAVEIDSRRLLD
jgi:hypothetical protein